MIKTEFICDRCGHSQPESNQMWQLVVGFRHYERSPHKPQDYSDVREMWCRKCCELFPQLLKSTPKKIEAPPPSYEDLLREIIRDELANAARS